MLRNTRPEGVVRSNTRGFRFTSTDTPCRPSLAAAGAHRPIRDGLVWIPFSGANFSQRVEKRNFAILNQKSSRRACETAQCPAKTSRKSRSLVLFQRTRMVLWTTRHMSIQICIYLSVCLLLCIYGFRRV